MNAPHHLLGTGIDVLPGPPIGRLALWGHRRDDYSLGSTSDIAAQIVRDAHAQIVGSLQGRPMVLPRRLSD